MKTPFVSLMATLIFLSSYNAMSVEVLSAKELASHCKNYVKQSTSLDGEFCARYIQGFIDGAVATDARVMLNVENELKRKESFHERVMRTRSPSRDEYHRAARYAEFCLGDPVLLKEVVTNVANELKERGKNMDKSVTARDVVYDSLKKHYPCLADKK